MDLRIGARVLLSGGKQGVVSFIGETDFAEGEWVGIELDKPEGKHNGSLGGKQYFTCPANHGAFVKREKVRVMQEENSHNIRSPITSKRASSASSRLQELRDIRTAATAVAASVPGIKRSLPSPPSQAFFSQRKSSLAPEPSAVQSHPEVKEITMETPESVLSSSRNENENDIDENVVITSLDNDRRKKDEDIGKLEEQFLITTNLSGEDETQAAYKICIDHQSQVNRDKQDKIKCFEHELLNQKSRFAKIMLSETKKNEEMALLTAKVSSSNRKIESLEARICEFEDIVEMMSLEKETLQMDKEIAQERVEECLIEIERLKNSNTFSELSKGSSQGVVTLPEDVVKENCKLRVAIKVLHERASEEKCDLNKKIRQLQRETSELERLRVEIEELTTKNKKHKDDLEELKELLDVAGAYESMVEELTEKNLSLGEKVADLESTITSLEALREVEEEMEHHHAEYEAELRSEIDLQRSNVNSLKQSIVEKTTTIEDKDRAIVKLRDLVQKNREENSQLRTQLRLDAGELESVRGAAHEAMNQTLNMRGLMESAYTAQVEAARYRLDAQQAQKENNFLRAVIPNAIFGEQDRKSLQIRLQLISVSEKSDILLHLLWKTWELSKEQLELVEGAIDDQFLHEIELGSKLMCLWYITKENLFRLECFRTTKDEFFRLCTKLDIPLLASIEVTLDEMISGFRGNGRIGAELSTISTLLSSIDELSTMFSSGLNILTNNTGLPECGVLKYFVRKEMSKIMNDLVKIASVVKLKFKELVIDEDTCSDLKRSIQIVPEQLFGELGVLLSLSFQLQHRCEIDLSPADDDLLGDAAPGGEILDCVSDFLQEMENFMCILEEIRAVRSWKVFSEFVEKSLFTFLSVAKEKLLVVFKSICRGSLTDAVISSSHQKIEGKPQWQIRAQEICSELMDAMRVRENLEEATQLCQDLHMRIRDLERSDGQYRVVNQKLESEVIRLSDDLQVILQEKKHLESQITKEREQFESALDESHKEKVYLDTINRELRKQSQRSVNVGNLPETSKGRRERGPVFDDIEVQHLIHHLKSQILIEKSSVAKHRIRELFESNEWSHKTLSMDVVAQSLEKVMDFSYKLQQEISMPRLVNLNSTNKRPHNAFISDKLCRTKQVSRLNLLRKEIAKSLVEDGWEVEIVNSFSNLDHIFGWQPPVLEHPPRLHGRVFLNRNMIRSGPSAPLMLDSNDLRKLSSILSC